jgi:molybdopterin/thiamine biosynthesis adenylyltransferase
VELGNVQRQILHWTGDVGRLKLDSAAEKLAEINPLVKIRSLKTKLTASNSQDIVARHDVVVDGTDNFEARYVINDACVSAGVPHVYGAVSRFEGRVSVFDASSGPCYRCLHPDPPTEPLIPDCAEMGVLAPVPGIIGSIQAVEAIKLLAGTGEPLIGRLLLVDALSMRIRTLDIPKDPRCRACAPRQAL